MVVAMVTRALPPMQLTLVVRTLGLLYQLINKAQEWQPTPKAKGLGLGGVEASVVLGAQECLELGQPTLEAMLG